ncbi:Uma2 family endonuclease [Alkalinema sp. FACHB-956]|uniref:Uma2 family endonuclease n=1 Tax=Alkalinema sp. FACHB-956 TaxID=2692768 RepID=UPI0016839DC3|nr:Uma2 family endonuclease [Alkalinema sp. FACHB-956]MBD2329889.1 Uma2 family endonuclease [Alkalinema sp. FACHB-956]
MQQPFYEFCRSNPDLRVERTAQGEVLVMAPTDSDTGNRLFNLVGQVGIWIEQDGTGLGFDSSAGFTLPNGATRSPDVSWIRRDRWEALTPEEQQSFAPLCPDFVIELKSASDRLEALQAKMQEYIDNGAQLGWLIDRQAQLVWIYRPNQAVEILDHPEMVIGDPELPGLGVNLRSIW